MKCLKVDIEMHDKESCANGPKFVQAKFLVHGFNDVMWTDSIEYALSYIREELLRCDEYRK
jgi:hypothetical protein